MVRLTRPFSSFERSTFTFSSCLSTSGNVAPSPTLIDFPSLDTSVYPISFGSRFWTSRASSTSFGSTPVFSVEASTTTTVTLTGPGSSQQSRWGHNRARTTAAAIEWNTGHLGLVAKIIGASPGAGTDTGPPAGHPGCSSTPSTSTSSSVASTSGPASGGSPTGNAPASAPATRCRSTSASDAIGSTFSPASGSSGSGGGGARFTTSGFPPLLSGAGAGPGGRSATHATTAAAAVASPPATHTPTRRRQCAWVGDSTAGTGGLSTASAIDSRTSAQASSVGSGGSAFCQSAQLAGESCCWARRASGAP